MIPIFISYLFIFMGEKDKWEITIKNHKNHLLTHSLKLTSSLWISMLHYHAYPFAFVAFCKWLNFPIVTNELCAVCHILEPISLQRFAPLTAVFLGLHIRGFVWFLIWPLENFSHTFYDANHLLLELWERGNVRRAMLVKLVDIFNEIWMFQGFCLYWFLEAFVEFF